MTNLNINNINSLNWSNWLVSIQKNRKHEKIYTDRFGNKSVNIGKKSFFTGRYLSSTEIISLSKAIFLKTKSSEERSKIISGLKRIVQSKKGKYDKLNWISKFFANLFGKKGLIDNEIKEVNELEKKQNLIQSLSTQFGISPDDIIRDCTIFNRTEAQMKEIYLKRQKKSEQTGFTFSTVTAIENIWSEILKSDTKETIVRTDIFDDKRMVIFIPTKGEEAIYIKESQLGKGTYKIVSLVKSYFENCQMALIQELEPTIENQQKEVEENQETNQDDQAAVESENDGESTEKAPTPKKENSNKTNDQLNPDYGTIADETMRADGGTVVANKTEVASGTVVVDDIATVKANNTDASLDTMKVKDSLPGTVSDTIVVGTAQTKNRAKKKRKKKEEFYRPVKLRPLFESFNNNSEMEKEIFFSLRFKDKKEFWKTYQATTINGKRAMIVETAGYPAKKINGEIAKIKTKKGEKLPLDLRHLRNILSKKELSVEDQCVYLDMIDQVLKGVKIIHSNGFIHRDIKPENALCTRDGQGKISDFGTATYDKVETSIGDTIDNPTKSSFIGTPNYLAPEIATRNPVFFNKKYKGRYESTTATDITKKSDVWSVGMMLCDLLSAGHADHPGAMNNAESDSQEKEEKNEYWERLANLYVDAKQFKYSVDPKKQKSESLKHYESQFPEPQNKDSILHLIWQCTRPLPGDRPEIKDVIKKFEKWSDQIKKELKEKAASDQNKTPFIQDLYFNEAEREFEHKKTAKFFKKWKNYKKKSNEKSEGAQANLNSPAS